jgi:N-acetyl-anhydromuramyl-L-alanine amidase AmpD
MRIEPHSTPNSTLGRVGRVPLGIVIHTTAGTFDGTCAWFANEESGVSAHYLVGADGRVARFVEEADTARHAGRVVRPTAALAALGDPNLITVGVEFEDKGDPHGFERPELQYLVGGELLSAVAQRWQIPLDRAHVVAHREICADKTCPGNLEVDRLIAEALEWGSA